MDTIIPVKIAILKSKILNIVLKKLKNRINKWRDHRTLSKNYKRSHKNNRNNQGR